MASDRKTAAAELVRIEAEALLRLAERLDGAQAAAFEEALARCAAAVRAGGRLVLTGIGKSGLIARKIAATMLSTGTPAAFLHPAEALHGDLGLVRAGDLLMALSYSGESEELLRLLPVFGRMGAAVIALTGCVSSTLARASVVALDVSVEREACTHQLAPTASTTAMLALGDALAIGLSDRLGFRPVDFAELHPGGSLGRRLAAVGDLMHTGDALPCVRESAEMPALIHEMSAKRLGLTTVCDAKGRLLGVISDGDLRRLLDRERAAAMEHTAGEVMHRSPVTVSPAVFASEALLLMEQRRITALVVTADGAPNGEALGVVHLHDLWEIAPARKDS